MVKEEIVRGVPLDGIKISDGERSVIVYADSSCKHSLYRARLQARVEFYGFDVAMSWWQMKPSGHKVV